MAGITPQQPLVQLNQQLNVVSNDDFLAHIGCDTEEKKVKRLQDLTRGGGVPGLAQRMGQGAGRIVDKDWETSAMLCLVRAVVWTADKG